MSGVETNILAPLSSDELAQMDEWWRAANYLKVGQIYLSAEPVVAAAEIDGRAHQAPPVGPLGVFRRAFNLTSTFT